MQELPLKYQHNKLKSSELPELRQILEATTDEELKAEMEEIWDNEPVDTDVVDDETEIKVWKRIEARTSSTISFYTQLWKWAQMAAVFILPVVMALSFYLYHENVALTDNMVSFATGPNEQATIVLPDGSKVMLNECSTLSYDSRGFNKRKRQMTFTGEGFFEVAKDSDHPFKIQNKHVSVSVLGTKFNLSSRNKAIQDELVLAEGSVLFTAVANGKHAKLIPNQKAVLNRKSGEITVSSLNDGLEDFTAWRRKELVFRNVPLSVVLETIAKHYKVTIQSNTRLNLNDLFTGTMSSVSINEDLAILETSYHLRFVLHDNKVVVSK